jgi:Mrp family chromosome partitioning ATPase
MSGASGLPPVLTAVRRRWLLCVLVALPFAVGVASYAWLAPSQYEADTTVAFSPQASEPVGADILQVVLPRYVAYLESAATVRIVAEGTGVDAQLVEDAEASIVTNTANLLIVVRDTDPDRAALVANELAGMALLASGDDELLEADQLTRALPPDEPSAPPRSLLTGAGVLGGLVIGLLVAVGAEQARPRLRSEQEVADAAGLRALGHVPRSRRRGGPAEVAVHPTLESSMRAVVARLEHTAGDTSVVALTSPAGRHGRTTLALAYAMTAARNGRRVVVVDADLSRRGLTATLPVGSGEGVPHPDVSAYLAGDAKLADCLAPGPADGVRVLPAPSDPGDQDRFPAGLPEITAALLESSDLVILDCPPVTEDDGQALLVRVPAVLFVVAADPATSDVRNSARVLRSLGPEPLGIVVNRSARGAGSRRHTRSPVRRSS